LKETDLMERAKEIRRLTVKAIGGLGVGHIGGCLSIVDLLAVLYFEKMNVDETRPDMPGRDRLVLSKGHAGPALYAALALKGFFPVEWLDTLNRPETRLPSHCDMLRTPGIDMTAGSLGQGISADSLQFSEKYSGVDTDVVIWNLLNIICSSPATASNPGAYIEAHKKDYDILVNSGELTLRYVYKEFLKGGQTGLNGHIMLSVMRDILSNESPEFGQYSTGQEGFDNFKSWAIKNST
jgi:hypothetical protein